MAFQKRRTIAQEFAEHKTAFVLTTIGIFIVLLTALAWADLLPNAPGVSSAPILVGVSTPATSALGETPLRISIDAISLSATISNPATTSLEVLDQALLSGAVRYPTSAVLGINGTVLIFGHSSYLPIVHNQAYKAFDGIQNLSKGDTISIFSATREYRYRVVSVKKVNVNDAEAATIPLPADAQHLVLVTCNSFASKADRFVVIADFAGY